MNRIEPQTAEYNEVNGFHLAENTNAPHFGLPRIIQVLRFIAIDARPKEFRNDAKGLVLFYM